ncbi:OxaA/SpoJ/YidC translocase/secretase, sec-independent itegration of nascent memrane proteins into membrane [Halalkaliarchaeum sp. AArc-CO]|uniref:DUF106 domain-containing protein n=1 Tax=unclassified Halalkaliarchaeum TaxID=2678344 RepID=UPI00217E8621|nr:MULTISPECIES: DUF106 domain-containing protein [unclassified Halalkaliarchaeum]MDR5671542.1 DUF106 domain-containing protein [Halalkaliarchaeum sp. AArc-GB]UWG51042.1 OxaA/SpoJ/YidC translocase/secretase, sec-independent itegration of nascent memrane proteins into membrane [Halalkaliarchaeum sp. AArc-CO]
MSRIERRVRKLVADDEMRDAVEIVLERAEDGELKWIDVREDLTSGQWGRLIEQEILVDGEEGFELADPEATRDGLEEDENEFTSGSDVDVPDTTSWTQWDKGALVATLLFFVGYTWGPIRDLIGNAVHLLLGPVNNVLPFYAVIMVIALATGLYSTLLRAALMDMDKMSKYQERMKDIQDRRKQAKEAGDDEALDAIQEEQMEAMSDQLGMFKEQFRPMVWIMFLTIPAFLWMYWMVGFRGSDAHGTFESIVIPIAGTVEWTTGLIGPIQIWIIWYFLCSMAFTQIIQKSLNIQMSPSTS